MSVVVATRELVVVIYGVAHTVGKIHLPIVV